MTCLYIFGAGGQAREVADIAARLGYAPTLLVKGDDIGDGSPWPRVSEADAVQRRDGCFAIGIGDNGTRARLAERYRHLDFPNLIHPDATISASAQEMLAGQAGVIVQAGVRISTNVSIGEFCNLNLNATISHDCRLGAYSTVSPGASVGGNVDIGSRAWIGLGASVKNGAVDHPITIGEGAVVGVGAVVVRDCDANGVYVGVPARRLK